MESFKFRFLNNIGSSTGNPDKKRTKTKDSLQSSFGSCLLTNHNCPLAFSSSKMLIGLKQKKNMLFKSKLSIENRVKAEILETLSNIKAQLCLPEKFQYFLKIEVEEYQLFINKIEAILYNADLIYDSRDSFSEIRSKLNEIQNILSTLSNENMASQKERIFEIFENIIKHLPFIYIK